jgi:hypothetical protein
MRGNAGFALVIINTAGCASLTFEHTEKNGVCACRLGYVCHRLWCCFVNQELEDTKFNCDLDGRGLQKLKIKSLGKEFLDN